MAHHTWQTTVTISTLKADIREMRGWLKLNSPPVPSTDADVIGKFLRSLVLSNAQWDGVPLRITVPRPRLAGPAPWSNFGLPSAAREAHSRDALMDILPFLGRAFALGLAAGLAIAGGLYLLRHHPPKFSFGDSAAHQGGSIEQSGIAHAQ